MSVKENNLITITADDMDTNDYVRVVDAGMSRKIKLNEFAEALTDPLLDQGFLKSAGNAGTNIRTETSDYTVVASDSIILANPASGNILLTIPTASSAYDAGAGRTKTYTFKLINTNHSAVILPQGGELIDGNTSYYLTGSGYPSITICTDGSAWWITD